MTSFDKLMLFLGTSCTTLTGAAVLDPTLLPKLVTVLALAVGGGCMALAPSVMASKRVPTPPTT